MMKLLPQLPQFWLDRHHCDTYIDIAVLCAEQGVAGTAGPNITGCTCDGNCSGLCGHDCTSVGQDGADKDRQHVLASVPCHRVLLSAASTYFAALLSATWSPSCPNNIKHIPVLLSDIDDLPAMTALLKCIYTSNVNLHRSDLAAVAAVNNTGSSAAAAGSSPVQPPTTAAAVAASGCPCTASLQQLLANFHDMCWQELSVRVLRLADQFSVPGALQAAVSNLSCLFSYQLSWPAVLAVLWLPPAVAQQPQLKEVRQMAMNRVTQDLKYLDPCLATSFGRGILQHLPPDALATLLASDELALHSENSTLAAIDVWLAGPIAASLARAADSDTGTAAAAAPAAPACDELCGSNGGSTAACGHRLAAALQLLVRQVRLPLCSGALLAAAVSQRPWLCLGMQGSHELNLMQQYYRAGSQGRYDLAMRLLRSGQTCPWSLMLRRGLPSRFHSSNSSIYAFASADAKGSSSSAAAGPVACTGLSRIRALLECGSVDSSSLKTGSSTGTPGSAAGVRQQQQLGPGGGAAAGGGVLIDERVLGGYLWQLSLVAVPVGGISISSNGGQRCGKCRDGMTAHRSASVSMGELKHSKAALGAVLCLSVCCRPAWANVLDSNNPAYDAAAVCHDGTNTAAAAAAACGAALGQQQQQQQEVAARCSTCDALWTIAGAKATEAVARHTPVTQQLLHGTAGAAAGVAAACHTCAASMRGSAGSSESTMPPLHGLLEAAAAGAGEVNNAQHSCCGGLGEVNTCRDVQVPGFCERQGSCSGDSSSTARLAHLDVVVGIQLVAASCKEQLRQQVNDAMGPAGQSPATSHLPCLLTWDAAGGAARGLIPIDVTAIGSGSNMLTGAIRDVQVAAAGVGGMPAAAGEGAGTQDGGIAGLQEGPAAALGVQAGGVALGGTGVEGLMRSEAAVGVLRGWQPELWSALAPTGALHWFCSLRPLMD